MKVRHMLTRALVVLVLSPLALAVNAQAAKSPMIDSVNKQMQRSAKPAKVSNVGATLKTSNAASTSSVSGTTKPVRKVQVPAITPQSGSTPKVARAVALPDSGANVAPPVRRAAKVTKNKLPAR